MSVVLLVEDDQDIREILQESIERAGFEVHSAGHGKAALELLTKIPTPDLIVFDMIMPVMNGRQFAKALSVDERLSSIPIIAMSAAEDRIEEIKACEVFSKPMNLKDLIQSIRKHSRKS